MYSKRKLAVIPTNPINSYEKKGLTWLKRYFNPMGFFDEVIIVSPYNEPSSTCDGMEIIGVTANNFINTLKSIKPNIVRAYGCYYTGDLACYNSLKDVPLIISVHGTSCISPALNFADLVICMSKIVAEKVRMIGVSDDKIRILPNRVDVGLFCPSKNNDSDEVRSMFPDGKMILSIARKTSQKNIETLIKALTYMSKDYYLVHIGQGDDNYEKLAVELGVSDRCFWINSIKNDELPNWYNACDCFCVPSRWEGFGVVFIEAAACGVPIITSNIAPMNEYLKAGEDAVLVDDFENPSKIADSIVVVCENKSLSLKLSKNARKASLKFDVNIVDENEVQIYKYVLENSKKITSSRKTFLANDKMFDEIKNKTKRPIIFGAGLHGKKMFERLHSSGIEPVCFIDNDVKKIGTKINGLKVHTPKILQNNYLSDEIVIIPNTHWLEMTQQLNEYSCDVPILDYAYVRWVHPVRVIIFGGGYLFNKYKHLLDKDYFIIGIVDNNWKNLNANDMGFNVINPSQINEYEFEKIILCIKDFTQVLQQLREMKIDEKKISFEIVKEVSQTTNQEVKIVDGSQIQQFIDICLIVKNL